MTKGSVSTAFRYPSSFVITLSLVFLQSLLGGPVAESAGGAPAGGSTASTMPVPKIPAPYAAGTDYKGPASSSALVDPNYEKCGLDCHYQKANENISLQANYILKKIEFLGYPSIYASDEAKIELLGSFYKSGEDLDECIARYVRMNRFWFVKVRSALGKNEESYSELHCVKMSPDGKTCLEEGGVASSYELPISDGPGLVKNQVPEKAKMAQATYFSNYDQLRQQPDSAQLASVQDGVLNSTTAKNYKPDKNDFIRFKKIAKPSGGVIEVPETGQNRYDEPAYQRAMAAWGKEEGKGEFYQDAADTIGKRKDFGQLRIQDKLNFKNDNSKNGSSPARLIFNEARGQYIDQVNSFVSQQGAFNSTSSAINFKGSKQSINPKSVISKQPQKPAPAWHTGYEEVNVPIGNGSREQIYYGTFSPNTLTGTVTPVPGKNTQPAYDDDILNPFF
ncbi:MAG: hypothetical protein ABIQ95_15605 [Bdellovibrionia bacterium]